MRLCGLEGVGVADAGVLGRACRAGVDGDAGDVQLAFAGVDDRRRAGGRKCLQLRHGEGSAADGHLLQAIGCGEGDAAGGGFLVGRGFAAADKAGLIDSCLAGRARIAIDRHDLRCAIGVAVDGDGERGRRRRAAVGEGVGKDLVGQCLPIFQRIDRRVAVVQRVAVAAVSANGQGTVFAHNLSAICARATRGNACVGTRRAAGFRAGADAGQCQTGDRRIRVAIHAVPVIVGDDVTRGHSRDTTILSHAVGIVRSHRRVVDSHQRDDASLAGRQRGGAAGIAAGLLVIAVGKHHGVGAGGFRRAGLDVGRVVAGVFVFHSGQHGLHLRYGGRVGEGDDQRCVAAAAGDAGNAIAACRKAIELQHVACDAVSQGDGDAARAEGAAVDRQCGTQVDVADHAAAQQFDRGGRT